MAAPQSSNDDMATMPIRDLIREIRAKTKTMDGSMLHVILVLNVLARRLEEQADIIDQLQEQIDGM